jgi:hypothetical protein
MAKDPLDALLGNEPIEDTELEDLLLAEGDKGDDDPLTSEKVKELEKQVEELNKEKQGFLSGIKDERRKRQELKGRLDQVTATIDDILDKRTQEPAEPKPADTNTIDGITVEFTEDGDAYIPNAKLNGITEKYEERIAELEERLQRTNEHVEAEQTAQTIINSIVGENESYSAAYNKYQAARRWVEERVVDFQHNNNVQGQLSSGQALDHIFNDNLQQEFTEKYPDMDLVDVVTAEDSKKHFRMMLDNTSKRLAPAEPDSRLTKVLNKPSGLGKSANAKGGEIPLSEKAASLSATDIMNLSDEQIEALQKALEREEQTDGIQF